MHHRFPQLLGGLLFICGAAFAAPAGAGFLNGVTSRDGVDVIAVGDSGMIYRSVDGAANLSKSYQGTTSLRAVASNGLTILIVGDGGKILRSTNSGMTWSATIVAGTPQLLGVAMPTANSAFVIGANGTLLRSTDGGANWTTLAPGTAGVLRGLRFVDANNGWIVGDNGFIRVTSNAGDNWSPGGITTANHLYAVDQLGSRVWAAGANGTCWKSVNGGANWTAVNLRIDSRSDVRAVTLQSADSVFIAGGGGFIWRSTNDGGSWTYLQHILLGDVAAMQFVGNRGFLASTKSPSVFRTPDRGNTWAFATGTLVSRAWSIKQALTAGSQRGSAIALNPVYRNTIYTALGSRFYVSRDDGETWTQIATLPAGYTRVNAFVVSPKDSLKWSCTASSPQVLLYSEDGGQTWTTPLTHAFGEYGVPIELNPDKPDTLLFGGDNDVLYRSINFGKTWATYGSKVFRSPCDLIVVPESDSNAVLVGDGITGSGFGDLWRSTDGGVTFTKNYTTTGSEIPGMSMGRLNNTRAFACNWSVGGVERSTDAGLNWIQVQATGSAWGTDVCREDPNVVIYGVYSGSASYLSTDGGNTYTTSVLAGSNYSFYIRDRGCILAQQGGGLYKLASTYTYTPTGAQAVTVSAPNGGESWAAGSVHDVTWSATGVVMARIEYRLSPADPWVPVADVPGYYGRYAWTCPNSATATAMVRVSDAFDASPLDQSDAEFTIALPLIANSPASLDFGSRPKGSAVVDSVVVSNPGTATLHVTSISTSTGIFSRSPASLTLAPAASGKVYVTFLPRAAQVYADQLTLVSDAGNTPLAQLSLAGTGLDTLRLDLVAPNGGETFMYGTGQKVSWIAEAISNVDVDYRVAVAGPWISIATSLPAAGGSYEWVIPDAPTATGRLRVRQSGGGAQDLSASDFSIVVPRFQANPFDIRDIGPVMMGGTRTDTLRIMNPGTAALTISSVSVNRPNFVPGRTSFVIPAGGADTIGITYTPQSTARDTAVVTMAANDPGASHQIRVTGFGTYTTGVDERAPVAFALWQNQPNPFTGSTRIRYALPRGAHVSLEVFNLQGQRVASLVNEEQGPGTYSLRFDAWRSDHGAALASGVYFYRFRAGSYFSTRKMLLMK